MIKLQLIVLIICLFLLEGFASTQKLTNTAKPGQYKLFWNSKKQVSKLDDQLVDQINANLFNRIISKSDNLEKQDETDILITLPFSNITTIEKNNLIRTAFKRATIVPGTYKSKVSEIVFSTNLLVVSFKKSWLFGVPRNSVAVGI